MRTFLLLALICSCPLASFAGPSVSTGTGDKHLTAGCFVQRNGSTNLEGYEEEDEVQSHEIPMTGPRAGEDSQRAQADCARSQF